MADYYELLELPRDASSEDIKRAFLESPFQVGRGGENGCLASQGLQEGGRPLITPHR